MPSQPKKQLTQRQRLQICKFSIQNPHYKQIELRKHFENQFQTSLSHTLISRLLQRKHEILQDEKTILSRNITRATKREFQPIESILFTWYDQRQETAGITGDILKEKAASIAKYVWPDRIDKHSKENWSNGWLQSFKAQYNIKERARHGESGSVKEVGIQNSRLRLQEREPNELPIIKIPVEKALKNIQELIQWVGEQEGDEHIEHVKAFETLLDLQMRAQKVDRALRSQTKITSFFQHV